MIPEFQSSELPRMRPKTSRNSAAENVTVPSQSAPPACGSLDSATRRTVRYDRVQPDRHVDVEDRLPADRLDQHAADHRADRDGAADRGAPDADRGAAVAAAVGRREQGQRRGEHHRPADALQPAREVEHERRGREPAQRGGGREHREADEEHAAAADPVGDRAGREQERRERQRVGVDHPLEVLERGAEVALDVRQRDVHDSDVDQEHERRDADGDEGPPLGHARHGTTRGSWVGSAQ